MAAEKLGGRCLFRAEIEPFCQRILRRRFPGVPLIEDVREVRGNDWKDFVDVLVGGFPCQGVSSAGKGLGLKDSRSGLWSEFFRVISEIRPKMVLIENVALLRSRGMDQVLYDFDSIGYTAEWDIISAAAVGAPHLRERIWIVARPKELATLPVYGEIALDKKGEPKIFSFVGKIPRAGRMDDDGMHELVPLAPRKTKRKDGWSYWVGVNLLDQAQTRLLWPSSSSRDWEDTGDLNCVPDKGLFPRRVFRVDQGNPSPSGHFSKALLPTSNANGNGNTPENHMRKKEERCGGPRFTITDLEVIARNDFRQVNGRLWPTTTTTDAKAARNETSGRTDPDSKHHSGTTLLDALIKNGDVGLWPTATARLGTASGAQAKRFENSNRSNDLDDAVASRTGANGSLNPIWVSWLMGISLWWTDPSFPTEFTTHVSWNREPLHVAPRIAKGIPFRAQQLRALGNAVVPHCAWYALARGLAATPEVGADDLSLVA